jgi:phage shock protein PspC (stress-responsive transcriptional regulator)
MNQHITDTPQIKRLERSSSDSMLAGVSGGLGRYFELNPAVFRLGFVILTLLGGAGILVYLAAILVIPVEGSEQSIAAQVLAERRDRPWPVVGLGLAGVALVLLLSRGGIAVGAGWIAVLIGGLAILWVSRRKTRPRRLLIALAGLASLLAVAATIAIVAAFAWFDVSLGDGVPVVLQARDRESQGRPLADRPDRQTPDHGAARHRRAEDRRPPQRRRAGRRARQRR